MKLLSTFDKSIHVKVSCIYKITNLLDKKVYIGQTCNFRKRLSDYKNIHKKENPTQAVAKAIRDHGTENFTIEILEFCDTNSLNILEDKYIDLYKSYDQKYGYNYASTNGANTELSRKRKSEAHIGLKESSETKRKKSNMILAIKDDVIIICDSGKLFGDFIGKSKDYIKNCLRQPSSVQGYRLYYDDYNKRQDIKKKMEKKRCIRDLGYMTTLYMLDKIESEGVETIDSYFKEVKRLQYADNDDGYELVPYLIEEPISDEFASIEITRVRKNTTANTIDESMVYGRN